MSPTLKPTAVAKVLAIVVGLCGIACLVVSGLIVYQRLLGRVGDSALALLTIIALAIVGAFLVAIAFRTFVRPTPAVLRHLSGVIGFLLFVLVLALVALVFDPLVAPMLGDTWRRVLDCVVGAVACYAVVFLHDRLETFLTRKAAPSHEKPSDHNET